MKVFSRGLVLLNLTLFLFATECRAFTIVVGHSTPGIVPAKVSILNAQFAKMAQFVLNKNLVESATGFSVTTDLGLTLAKAPGVSGHGEVVLDQANNPGVQLSLLLPDGIYELEVLGVSLSTGKRAYSAQYLFKVVDNKIVTPNSFLAKEPSPMSIQIQN